MKYKEQGEVFDGLAIWDEEKYRKHPGGENKYRKLQGTYPVIFLSFAGIKENQYDAAICHIGEIMQDLYIKNHLLLESDDDHK